MTSNSTNGSQNQPALISIFLLRQFIGIIGVTLAPVLAIITCFFSSCDYVQPSISHYYYTIMGDYFVGMMCAAGVFLICYKGKNNYDNVPTTIAGICAMLVAFFPTSQTCDAACAVVWLGDVSWRIFIHYSAAILFFISLAYLSLFRFPEQEGSSNGHDRRVFIYRICAIVMLLMVVLIPVYHYVGNLHEVFPKQTVFILETIALLAFGISWLTKGRLFNKKNRRFGE